MNRIIATEARNPNMKNVLDASFRLVSDSLSASETSIGVWSMTGNKFSDYINQSSRKFDGLKIWSFDKAFSLFSREHCRYKEDPLGQWKILQHGKRLPVYRK